MPSATVLRACGYGRRLLAAGRQPLDRLTSRGGHRVGLAVGRASTITRTSGSVPLRPHQHPARLAQLDSAASAIVAGDRSVSVGRRPRRPARCAAPAGAGASPPARSASGDPPAHHHVGSCTPVSSPSPVVARCAEDHVARLLAAERRSRRRPARRARSGRRPGVSTTAMPRSRHRQAEAEVGHHRDDDGVVGRAGRRSAVEGAGRRGSGRRRPGRRRRRRRAPVGVAVEGQAEVGAGVDDRACSAAGWVDPHRSLMLVPSGRSCEHVDRRRRARRRAAGGRLGRRRRWRSRRRCRRPSSRRPLERLTTEST